MSSVNDDMEDAIRWGYRLKRYPDISFTTSDTKVIARLQRQFAKGEPLSVNLQGWHGKAYVIKLVPHFSMDGLTTCDAVLKPTGRPCVRSGALTIPADSIKAGDKIQVYAAGRISPQGITISHIPKPPAGTIAQHIYSVPFTQTIKDTLAKHVSESIMREMKRMHPFDTGALKNSMGYGGPATEYVADRVMGIDLGKDDSTAFWYQRFDGKIVTFNYEKDVKSPCYGLKQLTADDFVPHHPNCRCVVSPIMGIRRKGDISFPINFDGKPLTDALTELSNKLGYHITKENRMKVRNKFYVAAPSVTTESEQAQDNIEKNVHLATSPNDRSGKWTRKDLAAAIAHAQQVLEADPTKDHVAVVKIVKIVRRPKPKYIVEDVK